MQDNNQPPKIELRGIKRVAWASQETDCYTATLYVDGEKWGTVGNEGHGGPDYYHGPRDIAALNARIKATMPPQEFQGMMLDYDIDIICGDLINEWLQDQDFKKAKRGGPMFIDPARPGLRFVKINRKDPRFQVRFDTFRAQNPTYRFLDDMPEAEAKAAYFKHGAC